MQIHFSSNRTEVLASIDRVSDCIFPTVSHFSHSAQRLYIPSFFLFHNMISIACLHYVRISNFMFISPFNKIRKFRFIHLKRIDFKNPLFPSTPLSSESSRANASISSPLFALSRAFFAFSYAFFLASSDKETSVFGLMV